MTGLYVHIQIYTHIYINIILVLVTEFHGASSNLDPVRLVLWMGRAYLPSGKWEARGGSGALLSSLRWWGAGGRDLQGGVRLLVARWLGGA